MVERRHWAKLNYSGEKTMLDFGRRTKSKKPLRGFKIEGELNFLIRFVSADSRGISLGRPGMALAWFCLTRVDGSSISGQLYLPVLTLEKSY